FACHPDHVLQFEQAWAMVTDGISFLAEFGYTGKPLLLTEAEGNPGWNPVGQAIADVVQRSDGISGLASFLDKVEHDFDPDAGRRRDTIRRQFYRPPGGSAAAIAASLNGLNLPRAAVSTPGSLAPQPGGGSRIPPAHALDEISATAGTQAVIATET